MFNLLRSAARFVGENVFFIVKIDKLFDKWNVTKNFSWFAANQLQKFEWYKISISRRWKKKKIFKKKLYENKNTINDKLYLAFRNETKKKQVMRQQYQIEEKRIE